jgi:hypothetical protein
MSTRNRAKDSVVREKEVIIGIIRNAGINVELASN